MTSQAESRLTLLLSEIEALLRAGNLTEGRRRLQQMSTLQVPRPQSLAFANLARRLDLPRLSLKILNPIVRVDALKRFNAVSRAGLPATPEEEIEYAASMRYLGVVPEAMDILGSIDAGKVPQAGFQLALCHIAEWRYGVAIPLLRDYISRLKSTSYGSFVARVNLIEAMIHEGQLEESRPMLMELQRESLVAEFTLVHRKTLELSAQLEIASENWSAALQKLEETREAPVQGEDALTSLFILKWSAIARAHLDGGGEPDLSTVRCRAIELAHWETVRDCDFHLAKIQGDHGSLIRLYFGTPNENYRRRILRQVRSNQELPSSYVWHSEQEVQVTRIFDLVGAETQDGSLKLSVGREPHRIMILLAQDFYRPLALLSLFSKLFPGERYNPTSSANRTQQGIKRLRHWLRKNSVPLEVEELSGSYRLAFKGDFGILVPGSALPMEPRKIEMLRLRKALSNNSFTTEQAMLALGTSRSVVRRFLLWAVDAGEITIEGKTRGAHYHWRERP